MGCRRPSSRKHNLPSSPAHRSSALGSRHCEAFSRAHSRCAPAPHATRWPSGLRVARIHRASSGSFRTRRPRNRSSGSRKTRCCFAPRSGRGSCTPLESRSPLRRRYRRASVSTLASRRPAAVSPRRSPPQRLEDPDSVTEPICIDILLQIRHRHRTGLGAIHSLRRELSRDVWGKHSHLRSDIDDGATGPQRRLAKAIAVVAPNLVVQAHQRHITVRGIPHRCATPDVAHRRRANTHDTRHASWPRTWRNPGHASPSRDEISLAPQLAAYTARASAASPAHTRSACRPS